jgi:tRNA pseudouridine65 synthase
VIPLFEDTSIVVVNKPSGVLVHPMEQGLAPQNVHEETCLSLIRNHCGQRVFPVHRLDRATSGALLFAKSASVANSLCQQFDRGSVSKKYVALVRGWMPASLHVDHPVWNEIRTERREAQTIFACLKCFELNTPSAKHRTSRYSFVQCEPLTGRYHQIRQHLKHLHHPIIGDTTHGDGFHNRFFRTQFHFHRLFLHAQEISFEHPLSQQLTTLEAPFPPELENLINELRRLASTGGLGIS